MDTPTRRGGMVATGRAGQWNSMYTVRDYLADAGIPHAGEEHKHGRPGWVQLDCPYCGRNSGKLHLGISLTTGAAACWRCGPHNTASVLATLTGQPAGKVRAVLDGAAMLPPARRPTGVLKAPHTVPLDAASRAYLAGRGFDPDEIAERWSVASTGPVGRLAWRLYIPVHHRGTVVSWTTRAIGGDGPRYISAAADQEAYSHKKLLYGADYTSHACIVHEGPIDAWATGPGAVALCGLGYTMAQVAALAKYAVRVVCFDSSQAAQQRAAGLCRLLAPLPGQTYRVRLTTGEDAAAADRGELAKLRDMYL